MPRIVVPLSGLRPNPFKEKILNGKLDERKVARLIESINQTGFWENVVCRKNDGCYELGYGHKRIEAAKRVFGSSRKIDIPCLELDDGQMIQMLAMENATGEEESVEAQVDVVRVAAAYLREKWEKEKLLVDPERGTFFATVAKKVDCRPDDPDSAERIAAFLGEKNWSGRKVSDLLCLDRKLDKTVLHSLRNGRTGDGERVLTQQSGVELTRLSGADSEGGKKTQRAIVEIIARGKVQVSTEQVRQIVKEAKRSRSPEKTAVKATMRAVSEAKHRAGAVKASHQKQKGAKDIVSIFAALLPYVRRMTGLYQDMEAMEKELGQNPLLDPPYSANLVVREFLSHMDRIAKRHTTLFGGLEDGSSDVERKERPALPAS